MHLIPIRLGVSRTDRQRRTRAMGAMGAGPKTGRELPVRAFQPRGRSDGLTAVGGIKRHEESSLLPSAQDMIEEPSALTQSKSYPAQTVCQSPMGGHSIPWANLAFRRETPLSPALLGLTERRNSHTACADISLDISCRKISHGMLHLTGSMHPLLPTGDYKCIRNSAPERARRARRTSHTEVLSVG
jgi:hypothetical protein